MVPALYAIDHVCSFVSDLGAAQDWYARVLGLVAIPRLNAQGAGGERVLVANPEGTVRVALCRRESDPGRGALALEVRADCWVEWRDHLQQVLAQNLAVVDEGDAWSIAFTDPDGNAIRITTHDHAEAAKRLKPRRG